MTNDLVTRLREHRNNDLYESKNPLVQQAADRITTLENTLRQAREALMFYDFKDNVPQEVFAAIDAVLSGAPPSELSDERIRELKKQLNDEGKIGLIAFARAVLKEGK